eukprot:gnl/MRDRNA2_/MRDRNA2_88297_c0_seq1.p1 gnl/MRDRNA2_/MRDRNA2_88297_c0~~gnl/MRDRNA2_/MRDRNA2_88297_c0_seq1.p1  ORF type:complete len:120 (+),score=7.09 gnl/MRDRNA2_/MRDRNA2_88297_c0_seq1:622-981(+)
MVGHSTWDPSWMNHVVRVQETTTVVKCEVSETVLSLPSFPSFPHNCSHPPNQRFHASSILHPFLPKVRHHTAAQFYLAGISCSFLRVSPVVMVARHPHGDGEELGILTKIIYARYAHHA